MAIGKFLLLGAKGLKTLTSINDLSKRPPQKPLTAMSRRAPWEVFAVALDIDSPSIGCNSGSTLTSWLTSVNRDAVRSQISLWRIIGKAPLGHDSACSTEKCEPQTQVAGRSCGVQP